MTDAKIKTADAKIRTEEFIKKHYAYFVTAIISSVVLLSCLIVNKCIPYGDNFPIAGLGFTQHYCWFVDCNEQIKAGNGLSILDYSQGLVKDNYDMGAYAFIYMLLRPWLYVIYLLVPEKMYIVIFAMGYYLYFILSGPVFIYFISHRRISYAPELSNAKLILLGLMYSMSSYCTAYFIYQGFRYMILVPVIFLGIEKLVYDNRPLFYILMLFFTMATDAYSSFILCIFIVMYFCTLEYDSLNSFVKSTAKLAVSSICSAGLAAFSLIPFFIRTRYSPYESGDNSIPSLFSWFGCILFPLSDFSPVREGIITTPEEYRANIYCGVVALLTLPLFYFIKRIKNVEKIKISIFLLITYLAFDNRLLNFIFHGFHHQWQVPNRYASFFIFMLLCVFAHVIGNLDDFSEKRTFIAVSFMALLICISYVYAGLNSKENDSTINRFIPGFILLGIYIIIFLINAFVDFKKILLSCIFIITCIELILSSFVSLKFSTSSEVDATTLDYVDQIKAFSDLYEDINDPFIITERPGTNDNQNIACLTNTNSISYYTSTSYRQMTDLMNRWGMLFSTNLTYYTTGSPLMDMMLHVKYHVTDSEDIYTASPYIEVAKCGELTLHQNKYALPLGVMFPKNENLDKWNDISDKNDSFLTPFDRDNAFAHCFEVDDIFDDIAIQRISSVEEASNTEENFYMASEDESGGASFAFLIGENTGGAIYMQVANSIEYIGTAYEGNCDTLYFYAPRTLFSTLKESPAFSVWNEQSFSELYNKLNDCVMTDQCYSSNTIKGKVRTKNDGLLYLAIPYLPGFDAYVDGNKCSIVSYMDGIGLELSSGEHSIELKYIPKGIWSGIIISAICSLGLLGYIIFKYIKISEEDRKQTIRKRLVTAYLVVALLPVTICINNITYHAFSNGWFIILSGLIIRLIQLSHNEENREYINDISKKSIDLSAMFFSALFLIMLPLSDVILNDIFIDRNVLFQIWKWGIFIPAIVYSTFMTIRFVLEGFLKKQTAELFEEKKLKGINIDSNKCFIFVVAETLFFLLSTYPGYYLQDDVLRVLLRVYENSPSDWDTYGYYLFVKIFTFNGKYIYGVNIIQALVWILVNLYIIKNLEKWSLRAMRLYTILTLVSVGPMLYLEIMYKDTVFSIGMLAIVAGIFNVIRKKSVNMADVFILTIPAFFATLCRKGGAIATFSGIIIMFLFLIRTNKENDKDDEKIHQIKNIKGIAAIALAHIFIYVLIYTILFNINNVKSVDPYVKYGTPLSMIGAAAAEGVDFDREDVEKLEQVMELSEWSRCYNRYWVDSIARLWGEIKTENLVQLNNLVANDNYGSFILKLNAKLLVKHPTVWFDSFFAMADQLWEISKPYDMPEYNAKDTQLFYFEQDESITYTPFYYITDLVTNIYNDVAILHTIFYRGGLSVFIMIFMIFILFALKKRKYILIFLPLVLYSMVLALAIPAPDMRYILPHLETAVFAIAIMSDIKKADDSSC